MATKKKATSRKKKSSVAGTVKLSGMTYKKHSCSTTKTGAKAAAKKLRAKGKLARVVGKCVYTRGAARRKKAA